MDTIEEQVRNFVNKCNELLQAKFIVAPSKISDLLRTVASTPALVTLFEEATKRFNYLQAQEECFLPSPDGTQNKFVISLPKDIMERLAFIFCLLIDIDNQTINFNMFLQTFFATDGSYTEGFELFCLHLIQPLKSDVCKILSPEKVTEKAAQNINETTVTDFAPVTDFTSETKKKKRHKKAVFAEMLPLFKAEITALKEDGLPEFDGVAGECILQEAYAAAKATDEKKLKALLLGYHYFLSSTQKSGEIAGKIFDLAEEL